VKRKSSTGNQLAKERRVNFNRTALGFAITAALAGLAGAACADPAFDAFRALCLDTGADYPAVAKVADAGDWKPVDVPLSMVSGFVASDKLTRGKSIAGSDANLAAWQGKNANNVALSDCQVQVGRADFHAAVANAQAWTGFAPQDTKEQKVFFHLTDVAGARKAIEKPDYDTAAAGPGLEIVTVTGGSGGVNFDVLKIKK
jgi:hypothetical protein